VETAKELIAARRDALAEQPIAVAA
jgi:hypothetical protein